MRKSILRSVSAALLSVVLSGTALFAQGRVTFSSIPLGTPYKTFSRELKGRAFKYYAQRTEDDVFLGQVKRYVYRGSVNGNPADVHILCSSKSETVYEVELYLKNLIDMDEAYEEANQLLQEELNPYKWMVKEDDAPSISSVMKVDISANKHFLNQVAIYDGGARFRLYESEEQADTGQSIGFIKADVLLFMGKSVVDFTFSDAQALKKAEGEK